jgi:periplasmic divalent cation tolerance protein
MDDLLTVVVTAPGGDGERIARVLVEEGLAACVNIVPSVRSIYRWEGKVEDESESLLVIKTVAGALEGLKTRIRQIHPYEAPELIALPIVEGLEGYLEWIRRGCSGSGGGI